MKNISDYSWAKIWTTKYSFLSASLFAKEYIKEMKNEVGIHFDHILLRYEEGLVTLFRIESETKRVTQFLAENSMNQVGFAERCVGELYKAQDQVKTIISGAHLNKESLESFVKIHLKLIPYFIVPIWASNEIAHVEGDENRKKVVLDLYAKARKDTEHLYAGIEKFVSEIYEKIGTEKGVNSIYLQALTPNELQKYIHEDTLPSEVVLKERYTYSTIFADTERTEILIGDNAKKLIHTITEITGDVSEIKVTKAFGGLVRGKVRIIFKDEDCAGFIDGEVLVTTMTRPEWLPVMKRAAAFVTDAGGILCHAAIVAREMKIPCVTNTKVASQVLKNGDMVEVDAEKGIVTILK